MTLDTATIPEALLDDVRTLWEYHRPGAGPRALAAHTAAIGEADVVIDALVGATPPDAPETVRAASARLRGRGYGKARNPLPGG